jgi:hypothetical protein
MDCEGEQRGLPGLAIIGLGEEGQLSEAPMIMFLDWQADPNSIFGEGDFRPRPQMDDWFCISQEPIAERRKTRPNFANEQSQRLNKAGAAESVSTDEASVSPVPLRPEDSQFGRLRPPSRLKMNSRCSALTAVLAGLTDPQIRAKGNCQGACTTNRTAPTSAAGEPPFPLDRDLSWMPNNRTLNERID